MQSPQPLLRNQKLQNHPIPLPTLYNSQDNHPQSKRDCWAVFILHSYPPVLGWVLSKSYLAWNNSHWATLPVFYPSPLTLTTATIFYMATSCPFSSLQCFNYIHIIHRKRKRKRSLAECIKILKHPPTHGFRVTVHPWTWKLPMHAMYFPICFGCSSCQILLPLLSSACHSLIPPLGLKHHFLFRIMSSSPVLFGML